MNKLVLTQWWHGDRSRGGPGAGIVMRRRPVPPAAIHRDESHIGRIDAGPECVATCLESARPRGEARTGRAAEPQSVTSRGSPPLACTANYLRLPVAPLRPSFSPKTSPSDARPPAGCACTPVVLAFVQRGLHRERDLALVRVHVDDLHVQLVAFLHHVARVLHPSSRNSLTCTSLDAGLDLHERAEVGHLGNLALHAAADRYLVGNSVHGSG